MKKLKFFVLFIFLFTCLFSQEEMKSKKALSFNFYKLNFSGLGGKIWLTDKMALVTNLDFDHSNSSSEMGQYEPETKRTSSKFEGRLGFERHLKVNDKISPYIGLNTGLGYELFDYEVSEEDRASKAKREEYTPLLNCILGIEYFVTKFISVTGQYNIRFSYTSGKKKYWRESVYQVQNYNEVKIGVGSASLILSVYL